MRQSSSSHHMANTYKLIKLTGRMHDVRLHISKGAYKLLETGEKCEKS